MDSPTPGAFLRIAGWFRDLIAIPGRLRRLDEARAIEADARPRCISCGFGRIGNLTPFETQTSAHILGRCNACHKAFEIDPRTNLVVRLVPPSLEDHVPHD